MCITQTQIIACWVIHLAKTRCRLLTFFKITVKPVLSEHPEIDKTKILIGKW